MTQVLVVLTIAAALTAGCSSGCDLSAALEARAGGGAKNCGYVTLGSDPTLVDACVVDAFQSGKPFLARYDRQGIDSKVVLGIAGDAHGTVTFLMWDGDPSGGSGAEPAIYGNLCVTPSVSTDAARNPATTPPLTCESSTTLGQTCG